MCSLTAIVAPALCSCFAGRQFVPPLPHLALLRSIGALSWPKWRMRREKTDEQKHRFDIGGWGEGIPIRQTGIIPSRQSCWEAREPEAAAAGEECNWCHSPYLGTFCGAWRKVTVMAAGTSVLRTVQARQTTRKKEQFSCQWVERKVLEGQMVLWNSSICQRTALNLWTAYISYWRAAFPVGSKQAGVTPSNMSKTPELEGSPLSLPPLLPSAWAHFARQGQIALPLLPPRL